MNFVRNFCFVIAATLAQAGVGQERTLTIQGEEYNSACAPSERDALKRQIAQASAGRQGEVLTTLVLTVLCGKDDSANKVVRQASKAPIKLTSTGTGSNKAIVTTVARAQLNTYAAAVWNASVETDGDKVEVHFYKNEACIETLTFRNLAKSWRLSAMAQACD